MITRKILFAAVLCLFVGACVDANPYEGWPLEPAGYSGHKQFLVDKSTGCFYWTDSLKPDSGIYPLRRPDGSQFGCRSLPARLAWRNKEQ